MSRYEVLTHSMRLKWVIWVLAILCIDATTGTAGFPSTTTAVPGICPAAPTSYIVPVLQPRCLKSFRPAVIDSAPTIIQSARAPFSTTASGPHSGSQLSSSTTRTLSSASTESERQTDSESPLNKENFLSFDQWRRRNLETRGQSLDQAGAPKRHEPHPVQRPPIDVLDVLGDDPEIELDFTTFATKKPQFGTQGPQESRQTDQEATIPGKQTREAVPRNKDAGKTCNERFNYASFDCAATVLKTNPKSSGSAAVLVENKDSYMLNECSIENKFLILELCEDILVDTIVLANFEFFSSIFRTFRVSVSDRYPVKSEKWESLGEFEAHNTREVQAFLVENPLIWAKYVRIEFLTHYGSEFYCPVSLVRVHGTTMLEDYRHDEDRNRADDRLDEDEHEPVDVVSAEAEGGGSLAAKEHYSSAPSESPQPYSSSLMTATSSAETPAPSMSVSRYLHSSRAICLPYNKTAASDFVPLRGIPHPQCVLDEPKPRPEIEDMQNKFESSSCRLSGAMVATSNLPASSQPGQSTVSIEASGLSSSSTALAAPASNSAARSVSSRRNRDHVSSSKTSDTLEVVESKSTATSIQPSPPNPTVQESFFKSVQKRLQTIETNTTLSLRYIEEQSQILRDAFSKVEQRQLSKTTHFLDYLNVTVLNELRDFRYQYDQLWQSTVVELETQREESHNEVIELSARLNILTQEVVFQKRMVVLQSVLVLFCIVLVLFPRGAMNSYRDHPLVQNVISRSTTLKTWPSFLDTPSMSPISSRPTSSHLAETTKAGRANFEAHRRMISTDSRDGIDNPSISYSPPTPSLYDGPVEALCDGPDERSSPSQHRDLHLRHNSTESIVALDSHSSAVAQDEDCYNKSRTSQSTPAENHEHDSSSYFASSALEPIYQPPSRSANEEAHNREAGAHLHGPDGG